MKTPQYTWNSGADVEDFTVIDSVFLCVLVFRMYRLHKLKVRRGLKEADFLKLLRSTFPQLAGDEPFDLFLYCNLKKLKPLQVDSVTPEEIIRVSRGSTLYIRLQVLCWEDLTDLNSVTKDYNTLTTWFEKKIPTFCKTERRCWWRSWRSSIHWDRHPYKSQNPHPGKAKD